MAWFFRRGWRIRLFLNGEEISANLNFFGSVSNASDLQPGTCSPQSWPSLQHHPKSQCYPRRRTGAAPRLFMDRFATRWELHMLDGWEKIVPMQWLNSKPKRSHGNCFQVSQDHVSSWKGRYWSKCYMHTQYSIRHLEFLQIDVAWAIIYLSKSTMLIPLCQYKDSSRHKLIEISNWYWIPWAPKTMKNRGFGHLKTRLFTIKTSKTLGFGGPWYILPLRFAKILCPWTQLPSRVMLVAPCRWWWSWQFPIEKAAPPGGELKESIHMSDVAWEKK